MCRLLPFGGTSPQARVCGDCLVAGGLGYRDAFLSIHLSNDAWMIWVCAIVFLGSLRCLWDDGSSSVALRVDNDVSRLVVIVRDLSPLCSMVFIVVAFNMYAWPCHCGVVRFSSSRV